MIPSRTLEYVTLHSVRMEMISTQIYISIVGVLTLLTTILICTKFTEAEKKAPSLQAAISSYFSHWKLLYFDYNMFTRIQWTVSQHWVR